MGFLRHLIALGVLAACSCQAVPDRTDRRAHAHNDLPAARYEVAVNLNGVAETLFSEPPDSGVEQFRRGPPTSWELLYLTASLHRVRTVRAADICLAFLLQIEDEGDAARLGDAGIVGWVLGRITGVPGTTTFDPTTRLRYDSLEMLRADNAMWVQWLSEHPDEREWPEPLSDAELTAQLAEVLLSPAEPPTFGAVPQARVAVKLLVDMGSVAAAEACMTFLRRVRNQQGTQAFSQVAYVADTLGQITGIPANVNYGWAGTLYPSLEQLDADLEVWEAWLKKRLKKGRPRFLSRGNPCP